MFHQIILGIVWITFCASQGAATTVDEVCCSEECLKTANQIIGQMGKSRACEDFHDYVCGNWHGTQETKETKLKKKALSDLIDMLENATIQCTTFNATDKLVAAYTSCSKQGKNKEALKISVKRVLGRYKLGEWPVLSDDHREKKGESYLDILNKTGPRPLFPYRVSVEAGSEAIILMTEPSDFQVSDVDYADYIASLNSKTEDKTQTSREEDYQSISGSSEEAYKDFIRKSLLLLTEVETTKAAKVAEEIVHFEKNLSKIASEAERTTERMNLSQLSARIGHNFPIADILQRDFKVLNYTISNSTEVKVQHIGYYMKVVEFLRNLTCTALLKNYIMWTTVRGMAEAEETYLHELYLEYKNKTSIFDIEEEKRSNDTKLLCLLQLLRHDIMFSAAANFYSRAKFDKESKNDVVKVMTFINSTFIEVIKNNTWMSDPVKDKAVKRITEITPVIGYPHWIVNNSVMNFLYKFVPNTELNSSFVEPFHWLQENEHFQKLLKLTPSYIDKKYEDVTLQSHAFYAEKTDILGYPAAALATHYRKTDIPRSLNFGTIGTIIAQLFTNAIDRFDDVYREGNRTKEDFWDNNTTKSFCDRSVCLNNTEECYDTHKYHNSSYEQLRDYFGVRVSHIALKRSKNNYTNPFLLPGPQFSTEDKIFFTAFGTLYCPYSVNKIKVQSRADIPEELYPDSLNEIVSQYRNFNTTFNCNGSVVDTCNLMPQGIISPSQGC